MFNTSPSRAIGVTLSGGFVNDGGREALEVRRRQWLGTAQSVDFSAGALRMDILKSPARPISAAYGLTTGVYLVGGDLIHLDGHVDVVLANNRLRGGASAGGGLGGWAAVGGTVVLAVVVGVVVAALSSGKDF